MGAVAAMPASILREPAFSNWTHFPPAISQTPQVLGPIHIDCHSKSVICRRL
jgi:hypothetical protein